MGNIINDLMSWKQKLLMELTAASKKAEEKKNEVEFLKKQIDILDETYNNLSETSHSAFKEIFISADLEAELAKAEDELIQYELDSRKKQNVILPVISRIEASMKA